MAIKTAEVFYPACSEINKSVMAAWISGAGKTTGRERRKLENLLPSYADMRYRHDSFWIEVDVPPEQCSKASLRKLAESLRSIILKGLGVNAGLCPVASSTKVLAVIRKVG